MDSPIQLNEHPSYADSPIRLNEHPSYADSPIRLNEHPSYADSPIRLNEHLALYAQLVQLNTTVLITPIINKIVQPVFAVFAFFYAVSNNAVVSKMATGNASK
ncbi:hypothetical protein QE152_g17080 [Popillia japonica]|uniref:Uncharacterized protein n=1 Tax=Popillia japonica TaxID=7064 RepID=A0AAW1L529_POPJA